MGLLFVNHQHGDLVAVVEKVAQRVEHLGLGQSQGFGNLRNRFPANMKGRDMTNRDAKAINDGIPAADTFEPDNMWMVGPDDVGHRNPLRREKKTLRLL